MRFLHQINLKIGFCLIFQKSLSNDDTRIYSLFTCSLFKTGSWFRKAVRLLALFRLVYMRISRTRSCIRGISLIRGGVEDARLKAKDTKNPPRPRTAPPRTDILETKAKNTSALVLKKKRSSKIFSDDLKKKSSSKKFFRRSSNKKRASKIFSGDPPQKKRPRKTFFSRSTKF